MVAGEVIYLGAVDRHFQDTAHHLHVFLGEITFFEIPDIKNIAVENERARLDTFQVIVQFVRMAAVGAQVDIGEYDDVRFAFHISITGSNGRMQYVPRPSAPQ